MLSFLKKQNGFALVGILIVIVIIAALAYGSSFFWPKNPKETKGSLENTLDTYQKAQQDLGNINQTIEEGNKMINQTTNNQQVQENTQPTIIKVEGTENWRVYEKPEKNVRLLYHKDWYYDRDEEVEKKNGYDLYVGFAESPEILAKGAPCPIEFIIVSKEYQFPMYYSGYINTITTKDDKQYILRTDDQLMYKEILDKMAESFEFLDEKTESSK